MKLYILIASILFSTTSFAQEQLSTSPANEDSLRKRQHALVWDLSSARTEMENKDSGAKSDMSRTESAITYLYNFGRFELGGGFMSTTEKDEESGDKASSSSGGLLAHFNFIENSPGNDFIPYLSLTLAGINVESGGVDLSGSYVGFHVGLKWFPLSEILALTASVGAMSGSIEGGSPKAKVDIKQGQFNIGWALYF